MDYYVVTAVSEERNISCYTTSVAHQHTCSFSSLESNANEYSFTVYGVTRVNESHVYHGSTATDCCEFLKPHFKLLYTSFL